MTYISNTPIFNIPIFHGETRVKHHAKPVYKTDCYTTNPLYNDYLDKTTIANSIKANPKIIEILKANKIPVNINSAELEKLKQGHLKDTRILAAKIYSSLPQELKQEVNLPNLQQAAMLHDIGKVLIPDKILNKEGTLNEYEKKIVEQHSELGYEILKKQGINQEVLNLVKYHHQLPDKTGYPHSNDNFKYDISNQIISCADKYSALREKRSYKEAMTKDEALNIIKQDVNKGFLSNEVFDALVKSVQI